MAPPAWDGPPPRLATDPRRRRPLISLTPLIDVVFILLIFFMLASSFLDWRAVELSAPGRGVGGSSLEGALLVDLRSDGLRLGGEPLSLDALARRVSEHLAVRPEQRVLLRPAAGVPLQQAVVVLDRLASVGATELALIRAGGG